MKQLITNSQRELYWKLLDKKIRNQEWYESMIKLTYPIGKDRSLLLHLVHEYFKG